MSKPFKIVVWLVLVGLLSIWMWTFGGTAKFDAVTGVSVGVWSLTSFLLLISVLVLGQIIFQQRRWALVTTAIIGIFFMMFFGWTWLNLVAIGIFALFNAWSANRVQREIRERKIMNIPDALYHGLTPLVLGLFLMISFAAYQSSWANQIQKANSLPSQSRVFFQQVVENTLGQKIDASTPQQRQDLLNEITSQTFQQFNAFLRPYFQYAPPFLAFGLFLILWGFSFIFIWMGIIVAMALYWLLKKSGIVRIEKKQVEAEILVV